MHRNATSCEPDRESRNSKMQKRRAVAELYTHFVYNLVEAFADGEIIEVLYHRV